MINPNNPNNFLSKYKMNMEATFTCVEEAIMIIMYCFRNLSRYKITLIQHKQDYIMMCISGDIYMYACCFCFDKIIRGILLSLNEICCHSFYTPIFKTGRIMVYQCPTVRPSVSHAAL